jgi:hypothetical protein
MMNSKTQIVIHSDIKKSGQAIALKANEAVRIKVESGKKYILNSDVTVTRAGNDLLIALEGSEQPSVVLEDYFAQTQTPGVYGIAEDGRLYEYTRTDGVPGIFSIEDGATEPVALGGDALGEGAPYLVEGDDGNSFFFLPWLLGGLGLAALGGALYAASLGKRGFRCNGMLFRAGLPRRRKARRWNVRAPMKNAHRWPPGTSNTNCAPARSSGTRPCDAPPSTAS